MNSWFQDILMKPVPTLVSFGQEETKANVACMQRTHYPRKSKFSPIPHNILEISNPLKFPQEQ
jgi:hypothetical protein